MSEFEIKSFHERLAIPIGLLSKIVYNFRFNNA